jgi:hypothetical protein
MWLVGGWGGGWGSGRVGAVGTWEVVGGAGVEDGGGGGLGGGGWWGGGGVDVVPAPFGGCPTQHSKLRCS